MPTRADPLGSAFGAAFDQSDSIDPVSQQLLNAAIMHGGAVAQTASEIVHPNGSFLSWAKEKLGGAFSETMDALAMPQEAVAALMSQASSNPISLQKALSKHITPSDIIFGKQDKHAGLAEKVGMFGARFATDVLLDPLTYVTFGTSSGVFGLSKLTEIPLAGATAKRLGLSTYETVGGEEAIRHRAVSDEGLQQLQKITSHIEDTLKRDTLESFMSDTNIRGRLRAISGKLSGSDEASIKDFMSRASGAEYILAEKMLALKKGGEALTSDKMRFASQIAIDESMKEQSESLVRHTVAARRSDIEQQAKSMMSKIIERNVTEGGIILDKLGNPIKDQFGNKMVRDLSKEWIDRGGIKAFGYGVVSGARIRSVINTIPMFSHVDKYTAPIRAAVASIISTKYNSEGRIPDTLLQIQQKARDLQDYKQAEAFAFIPQLYKKLGITSDEDKIISQAIAADIPPSSGGDGRLETLWSLLHTDDGNNVAKDIASGKYGDDIGKMWRAASAIKQQMKSNLVMMHEAGIASFPQKNYIPGVLNEQKRLINPFSKFKTAKALNAEKAEMVKWRNVDDPGNVMFGIEGDGFLRQTDGTMVSFERLSKAEERQRLEKEIQDTILKTEEKKNKIQGEVEGLWNGLSEKMLRGIYRGSKEVISGATDDVHNEEALLRLIRDTIPKLDRERVLKDYVSSYYKEGAKLHEPPTLLTPEDILQLKEDLAAGDEELGSIASHITSHLEDFGVKVSKPVPPGTGPKVVTDDYQNKLKELMTIVRESAIKGKVAYLKGALSGGEGDKTFTNVLTSLSEEWHKNPGGISRTMEAILGKNFELSSFMEDMSDTKRALESELKGSGLKKVNDRWFYKDSKDNIYERIRATAKEINDNYFKGEEIFTESSLKASVVGSLNAIRASASRELLDDIAKRFGVPRSAAPSNFVQLGIAGLQKEAIDLQKFLKLEDGRLAIKNAEGEELFFNPTVAQSVNSMLQVLSQDPASSLVAKSYDKLTNIWKASVTSVFPSFHGRNAISNVFQHMMDIGYQSLNPAHHIMAAELIKYNHEIEQLSLAMSEGDVSAARRLMDLQNKTILTDKAGRDWTVGELVRLAKDNVIAFHPNVVGQTDVFHSSSDMVDAMMDDLFPKTNKYGTAVKKYGLNPLAQNFAPFKLGRTVGNAIEWQARLVDFLANLKNTGDVEHAAYQTKQFLFDYQNLTPFERNVMRRIIPFYTYSRKNLELQVSTLLTKPGRIAAVTTGFASVGDVWGGAPLSDEERAQLPEWIRDGANIVIKRNSGHVTVLTSLGTPLEQPYQQVGNLLGSLNPIIKGPLENLTNFSFFNGKPLSQVTNATAFSSPLTPQVIKDFIGYTENKYIDKSGVEHTQYISLKPGNMNVFNNLPFTPRVISTLKLMQTSNVPDQLKLLQFLIAMKPEDFDLNAETQKRHQEMRQQLQDVLDNAGIGYKFTRFQLKKPGT